VKYGFVVINSYLGVNIEIDNYLWAWIIALSLIISTYASSKSMKRILV
jgi:ABC-type multidrug transport system permease subunit